MRVKVVKTFRDRHSGEIHKAGKSMTISKERFDEIVSVGKFVEEIKTKKAAKTAE